MGERQSRPVSLTYDHHNGREFYLPKNRAVDAVAVAC